MFLFKKTYHQYDSIVQLFTRNVICLSCKHVKKADITRGHGTPEVFVTILEETEQQMCILGETWHAPSLPCIRFAQLWAASSGLHPSHPAILFLSSA